jgi:hypothetical protein
MNHRDKRRLEALEAVHTPSEPWVVRILRRVVRPGKDGPTSTGTTIVSEWKDGVLVEHHTEENPT